MPQDPDQDEEVYNNDDCYYDDDLEEWVCDSETAFIVAGRRGGGKASKGGGGKKLYPTTGVTVRLKSIGKGKSSFKLQGLDSLLNSYRDGPGCIIVQDVQYEEKDVFLPILAVNDKRIIYRFGKNFGRFTIICTAYVMDCKGSLKIKLNKIQEAFEKVRLASKANPSNVSACGLKCKVYYTNLEIGRVDPKANSINFSITGVVAPKGNK